MRPSQILKKLLLDPNTLVVPDAFDGLSARIIQESGFQAVQCSGHSIARSIGLPNDRNLSLNSNLAATQENVQTVTLPVMADDIDKYPKKLSAPERRFSPSPTPDTTGMTGDHLVSSNSVV